MPVMPRPAQAQKISDKVMKNNTMSKDKKTDARKVGGETKFDREVRTMIKR